MDNFAAARTSSCEFVCIYDCTTGEPIYPLETRQMERSVSSLSLFLSLLILLSPYFSAIFEREHLARENGPPSSASAGKWYYKSVGAACGSRMKGIPDARLLALSEDAQSFKDAPFDGSRSRRKDSFRVLRGYVERCRYAITNNVIPV